MQHFCSLTDERLTELTNVVKMATIVFGSIYMIICYVHFVSI